jgi:hypothetical protein
MASRYVAACFFAFTFDSARVEYSGIVSIPSVFPGAIVVRVADSADEQRTGAQDSSA